MSRDLFESAKAVSDRESFLRFVRDLIEDRVDEIRKESARPSSPYEAGANGWENTTIESFLEGALRWAEDSGTLPVQASWKAFAQFLYCGKIYE